MSNNPAENQGRCIRARDRVTAQNLSLMAKRLGRCGDIDGVNGYVCVTQPHDEDMEHMAIQIGGPFDGHVYARWGGMKLNDLLVTTQQVPSDH